MSLFFRHRKRPLKRSIFEKHLHDMPDQLQYLVVAATVSVGLIAGLLFAFSVVVMRALSQLPPALGMLAMQRINVLIINPMFLLVFLGGAALCVAVAVLGWQHSSNQNALFLLAGACAYLLGPLGITMAFNVPLNNKLAKLAPSQAENAWPMYVSAWLGWNHVRTALGVLSCALLCLSLVDPARVT